jgi:peptidoglycan/LPS O-acetylase OafA/YrhL
VIRSYRPDLDGLRTVAVYLVLLFHAGLSWFVGGFIGVDLFFCLSGFLVTSVLMAELQDSGSLRVGRFYSRRVRRLLPAAVVVVVAVSLAFTLLWTVVRRASLVGDAASALLYYANIHFIAASGDYFATDVDKSPFLHFWSLSIEEQFYAFFPLLLLLLYRVRPGRRKPVMLGALSALLVLSLADQLFFAARNVDRAYYGTDTRLYQLLAGALLTTLLALTARRLRPSYAHAIAVVGLVGVLVVASGLVDLDPSWRGIGATVTALMVLGGLAQSAGSALSRLLSVKPMVYLGKISYGTYLWHWPVIIALRTALHTDAVTIAVLSFVLATGLAALSYELLELPIRRTPRLDRFTWPVVLSGLTASAVVAATLVPHVLQEPRRPALAGATEASGTALSADPALKHALAARPPHLDYEALSKGAGFHQYCSASDVSQCHVVQGEPGPTVLLVGDSQAETMAPVFERLAREHHVNLDLDVVAGCPWQEELTNDRGSDSTTAACTRARVGWYDDALPQLHPDVVVLLGRPRDDPAEWGSQVTRRDGKDQPLPQAVWESTRDTLAKVVKVAPAVVVQRLIMAETFSPADCLAAARTVGECVVTAQKSASRTDGYVTALSAMDDRVHPLDLNPIFCPTAPVCSPIQHRQLVWKDDHHYTVGYAMAVRERIWAALEATGTLRGG